MEGPQLKILERVARNLPIVTPLEMRTVEAPWGKVYIAFGKDAVSGIHGIWGLRDIARTIEFKPGTAENMVVRVLYEDACGFGRLAFAAGMYDEGWWRGGRTGTTNA